MLFINGKEMASIYDILLLYELSNQKGSTHIGYHGSNLQT